MSESKYEPLVSVIIIALNEEKALPKLLSDLAEQSYKHKKIELLLVDGMSSDKTAKIMLDFAKGKDSKNFYAVKCLKNKKVIQSSGWNVGIKNATGDVVFRFDAHATIPKDFIEKNIKCLAEGHDICGGKVENYIPNPSKWADVVNAAENSMFGGSVAAFRHKDEAGVVSTLAFAAYKKECFDKTGLFDERLTRTEDNELHYRMRKAGYEFYYTPEIKSKRETRPSFRKLLRQKTLNGYEIGRTLWICPQCFSIYHLVPLAFVLAIIACSILAALKYPFFIIALSLVYISLIALLSLFEVISSKKILRLSLILLIPGLHVGYGLGTLIGIFNPYHNKK